MTDRFEIAFDQALIRGEADGFGLPVVLLHAGVCDRRMWGPQIDELVSAGYHVISYDRRGHGDTESSDVPFSHAVDLEAVLDRLGLNAVVLVGCSRGGALALDFALEHPDRVVGLVLIGSSISGWESTEEPTDAVADLEGQIGYAQARENLDLVNRLEAHLWLDGPDAKEGRVEGPVRDLFLNMNAKVLAHAPLTQEDRPDDTIASLDLVSAPVLLIAGDLDLPEVHEMHDEIEMAVETSFSILIEDTAHLPSLERPDLFNPVLLEFLEALSGGGEAVDDADTDA